MAAGCATERPAGTEVGVRLGTVVVLLGQVAVVCVEAPGPVPRGPNVSSLVSSPPEQGAGPSVVEDDGENPVPALRDQALRRHPLEIEILGETVAVSLWLPADSPRADEYSVNLRKSLASLREGWPGLPCRSTERLHVFELEPAVIDDAARFPVRTRDGLDALWGVYDPFPASSGDVVIAVRALGERHARVVLGHELAHFWHDRTCMDGDTEAFAESFEELELARPIVQRVSAHEAVVTGISTTSHGGRWRWLRPERRVGVRGGRLFRRRRH